MGIHTIFSRETVLSGIPSMASGPFHIWDTATPPHLSLIQTCILRSEANFMLPPSHPGNTVDQTYLYTRIFLTRIIWLRGGLNPFCNLETSNFYGPGHFCPTMGKSGMSKSGKVGTPQEGKRWNYLKNVPFICSGPLGICTLLRKVSYLALCDYTGLRRGELISKRSAPTASQRAWVTATATLMECILNGWRKKPCL